MFSFFVLFLLLTLGHAIKDLKLLQFPEPFFNEWFPFYSETGFFRFLSSCINCVKLIVAVMSQLNLKSTDLLVEFAIKQKNANWIQRRNIMNFMCLQSVCLDPIFFFLLALIYGFGNYLGWWQRYGEISKQRLDRAILTFLQNFKKSYIGDQAMHSSKVSGFILLFAGQATSRLLMFIS